MLYSYCQTKDQGRVNSARLTISRVWLEIDDSVTGEGVSRVDVNFVNILSSHPSGRVIRVDKT